MNVGILGLGLIGGSLARAYALDGHTVYACEKDLSMFSFAMLAGAVHGSLDRNTVSCCDLILLAIYPDGSAHLTSTGGLAGSTLKINQGLLILVEEAMVPFNYAINSCTINPARCLGIDDRKGKIGVGYDADIVVLDTNYDVIQTYCKGQAQL